MCPISGLVQFLIIVVSLLLICHCIVAQSYSVSFEPQKNVTLHMDESVKVYYDIAPGPDESPGGLPGGGVELEIRSDHIATLNGQKQIWLTHPKGSFNITGVFLGRTEAVCVGPKVKCKLDVRVVRRKRIVDTIFTSSVATLVAIIYINFGCALNWQDVMKTLKRPVGPLIGFAGQFLVMPLLSFFLGKLLFPDNTEMQLGMFFTGVSPAGGASNIWTVVLDGNLDLSVTMTTISTLAAFGMMPLWLFTLGKSIFDEGDIKVPYSQISTYAIALVVPLAIGYLISKYMKKVGTFMVRTLKGFSGILLLFIIIFAIVTNLYLFKLFSWEIVVAGMGLPYLGFILGYILARIFKQPAPDCLAIAIETGIQNTGIAIFLLRFTLSQPEGDLTTIVPVSVAMMTPFPLMLMWAYKKLRERLWDKDKKALMGAATEGTDLNPHKEDRLIASIS